MSRRSHVIYYYDIKRTVHVQAVFTRCMAYNVILDTLGGGASHALKQSERTKKDTRTVTRVPFACSTDTSGTVRQKMSLAGVGTCELLLAVKIAVWHCGGLV